MTSLPHHNEFQPSEDDAGTFKLDGSALDDAVGEEMATRGDGPNRPASSDEDNSLEVEQQIQEMLANASPIELAEWGGKPGQDPLGIPPGFRHRLRQYWLAGRLRKDVEQYYLTIRRGDSTSFPDQHGGKSVVQAILKQDALSRIRRGKVDRWKPGRVLGTGGYGSVILWEKHRRYGPVCLTFDRHNDRHCADLRAAIVIGDQRRESLN